MPTLRVRPQRTPYHARQVARFVAIAFTAANMLANRAEQDAALDVMGNPALLVNTPDGREFLITVTEVEASRPLEETLSNCAVCGRLVELHPEGWLHDHTADGSFSAELCPGSGASA